MYIHLIYIHVCMYIFGLFIFWEAIVLIWVGGGFGRVEGRERKGGSPPDKLDSAKTFCFLFNHKRQLSWILNSRTHSLPSPFFLCFQRFPPSFPPSLLPSLTPTFLSVCKPLTGNLIWCLGYICIECVVFQALQWRLTKCKKYKAAVLQRNVLKIVF